jgi:lipopolysaccharide export LptBFGC system permease protein LptF
LSRIDFLYAREILSLTAVFVASVSSVMFVFRILAYADFVFVSQDSLSTVILFIVFLFPSIFKLTIPISLLLASLVVTMRMCQDREIEALMASGASLWRLVRAPSLLGLLAFLASVYTGLYLEPYSREQMSQFRWMQTVKGIESFISSRLDDKTFLNDIFPLDDADVSLYVDSIAAESGELNGVFLSISGSEPSHDMVLMGKTGYLRKEFDGTFPDYVFTVRSGRVYQPGGGAATPAEDLPHLVLSENGLRKQGPVSESAATLLQELSAWDVFQFDEVKLSLFSLFRKHTADKDDERVDIRTLEPYAYIQELKKRRQGPDWGKNKKYVRDHTYFYEAATVPLSCLFLPMIGICLGVSDPRRKHGWAYLSLGVVMFIYYAVVMVCQQLALRFVIGPEWTLWLPPFVLALMTGILLRWRSAYPPSTGLFEAVASDSARFFAVLRKGSPSADADSGSRSEGGRS